MIKVDLICPSESNSITGPVVIIDRILKNNAYFSERGYEINAIFKDSFYNFNKIEGIERNSFLIIIKKRLMSNLKKYAKYSKLLSALLLYSNFVQVRKFVIKYLSLNRNPDIVIFDSDFECYHFLKLNKNKKIKSLMFLHTDGIPHKMDLSYYPKIENTFIYNKLVQIQLYTAKNVNKCAFIADIGRENFLKYFPFILHKKTAVVINGIEDLSTSRLKELNIISNYTDKTSPFKYRLCCSGTIASRKGQKIVLDALSKLDSIKLKEFHVTFIGDGFERESLENFVSANKLTFNVSFIGSIKNNLVDEYLAMSNIYILMSKNEGLPISIIEGMRIGLPIISTKISGIPELVNGENGILINPDSIELITIFENMEKYNWVEMGRKSRSRFENEFTYERTRKEYADLLDEVSSYTNI